MSDNKPVSEPRGYTRDHHTLHRSEGEYGATGVPRGPLGRVESPQPTAIGYCPHCGTNARQTTTVRGVFNCPECTYAWYDERVGEHSRDFDDYFEPA